jgi:hypothetical protein
VLIRSFYKASYDDEEMQTIQQGVRMTDDGLKDIIGDKWYNLPMGTKAFLLSFTRIIVTILWITQENYGTTSVMYWNDVIVNELYLGVRSYFTSPVSGRSFAGSVT